MSVVSLLLSVFCRWIAPPPPSTSHPQPTFVPTLKKKEVRWVFRSARGIVRWACLDSHLSGRDFFSADVTPICLPRYPTTGAFTICTHIQPPFHFFFVLTIVCQQQGTFSSHPSSVRTMLNVSALSVMVASGFVALSVLQDKRNALSTPLVRPLV